MNLIICKSADEMTLKAEHWLKTKVSQSLFCPAGETPKKLYQRINGQDFFKKLKLYQIDEIISGSKQGEFKKFFENHLPDHLDQFVWIDQPLGQARFALLGFGKNGHLAFHEPHLPPSFMGGEVELSQSTCETLQIKDKTRALTYGIGAFLKTEACLLLITGSGKQNAFQDFLANKSTIPAVALKKHNDLTVLVSQEISDAC